jgi:mono/diheme cytochrome c family protein
MVALLLYGGAKLFGGHKKELPPVQLTELQERDDKMLNTYGVLDVERGVYQVPVNQTFAMLTGNPRLLEPSVLPPADLDEMSPTERGEWLFHKSTEFACGGCHKVDGTQGSAPSLRDKFGQETKLDGADPVQFDDAYFLESLENPEAKFADGFAKSTTKMPSFKGKVSKQQLEDFKAYLKSL